MKSVLRFKQSTNGQFESIWFNETLVVCNWILQQLTANFTISSRSWCCRLCYTIVHPSSIFTIFKWIRKVNLLWGERWFGFLQKYHERTKSGKPIYLSQGNQKLCTIQVLQMQKKENAEHKAIILSQELLICSCKYTHTPDSNGMHFQRSHRFTLSRRSCEIDVHISQNRKIHDKR